MKNKKRFVPWLIAAVIIAAFAVIGKKLYDLMFGGSLAVTTEDLKNGIIACSPATAGSHSSMILQHRQKTSMPARVTWN